jgi:hypothetical protein
MMCRGRTTPSRDRRRAVRGTAVDRRAQRATQVDRQWDSQPHGPTAKGRRPPYPSARLHMRFAEGPRCEGALVWSTPIEPRLALNSELVETIVSNFKTSDRRSRGRRRKREDLEVRESRTRAPLRQSSSPSFAAPSTVTARREIAADAVPYPQPRRHDEG